MPKLSQSQVEAAQNQGYDDAPKEVVRKPLPIADGQPYVYKLIACTEAAVKSDPTGKKRQWVWELTLDNRYHPEFCNGEYLERVWYYTPVEGGREWAIAKVLHSFGYSPDTDTDELINDEATVLAYLTVDTYGPAGAQKTKMVVRRFAQHYDEEFPPAQGTEPPFGGSEDPHAPNDDPWATPAPEQAAAQAPAQAPAQASVPPQAEGDPEDTF